MFWLSSLERVFHMEQTIQTNPMKGLMQKFNHNNIFDVDTKDFKWVDLKTLYNTDPHAEHKVLGFFTNSKGKFGTEPVAIIDGFLVNLPRHLLDTINQMLDDNEVIEYIKDGHVGFTIYEYHSNTYDKDAYSVTWLDL